MASVLERFVFLFESDAKKAEKDLDNFDKKANETADGVEGVAEEVENLNEGMSDLIRVAGGVAVAFGGIGALRLADEIFQGVDVLGKFTDLLGVAIEQTDAWGQATKRFGGDAGAFQSSLENLNNGLVETSLTGQSALVPFFNLLGISAIDAGGKVRDAFEVLPEIATAFESLSKQESAALGKQLGLDPGTILLLQQGRREVDSLVRRQKELGVVTEAQKQLSAEYTSNLSDTQQVFGSLAREILTLVLPTMNSFLESLTETGIWMRQNKPFVIAFIGALTTSLGALAIATLPISGTFLAISAAILAVSTAVALVVDDFIAWSEGAESVIGKMIKLKDEVSDFLGFGDMEVSNTVVNTGKALVSAAGFPLAAQVAGAVVQGGSKSNTNNLSVQNLTIQTQAADSDGIASTIFDSLQSQMKRTRDAFDDGVKS